MENQNLRNDTLESSDKVSSLKSTINENYCVIDSVRNNLSRFQSDFNKNNLKIGSNRPQINKQEIKDKNISIKNSVVFKNVVLTKTTGLPINNEFYISTKRPEKLIPVMNVTSSVEPTSPNKKKIFSVSNRTQSAESDNSKTPSENSKTFSSQESLQSPKHTGKIDRRSSKNSSVSSSRESVSSHTRRLSTESTRSLTPKQTSTSLRRQSLTKSTPSLKTITQKKLLGALPKKNEKAMNTELTNLKYVEPKVDSNRRQIAKAKTQVVASVTQRLYAKANKKDSGTGTDSFSNSSRSDLPKELTICSSARSRLKELTQRVLKAHKNKNAETQTELRKVLRVKEASTDCIGLKEDASVSNTHTTRDAIAECSLLNNFVKNDLQNILNVTRSCGIQTTDDRNPISFRQYLTEPNHNIPIIADSLNINISHNYINGIRNGSVSDDSLDSGPSNVNFPTPDLISNHNSLEQHVLTSANDKLKFPVQNNITSHFEKINLRLPAEELGYAHKVINKPETKRILCIKMNYFHAPQIIMSNVFNETCKPISDFKFPDLVSPRLIEYRELKYCEPLIIRQPVMERTIFRITTDNTYCVSEDSLMDQDPLSDVAESVEYQLPNREKVQFRKGLPNQQQKNERLFQAMTEFVSEATTLMKNLTNTATKLEQTLCKNYLKDYELQVTVHDFPDFEIFQNERKKMFSNSAQTEQLKRKSCCSQTSEEILDFMTPLNRHKALLNSCKKLEEKLVSQNNRNPKARQISVMSQDSDNDSVCNNVSRAGYNPWDLSALEVEDSSLESNPVTFSDYGSLPRKTHKRRRTPTCSPSAFLRQLTNMRKQVIQSSREELQEK